MKSILTTATISLFLLLGLTACRGPAPTNIPPTSPLVSPLNSPLPTPVGTTPPGASQITGPNFEFDRPILPGATEVTGQGPIDLTIAIVDMTMMGNQLGTGTIDHNGKFSVSLNQPVIENHVIGIQVVTDRDFTTADIDQLLQKRGPEFKNYPQVGEAFDTVVVRNPE